MQFVERESEIGDTITKGEDAAEQCANWDSYYAGSVYKQDDSGI
jgi:hypothetical protein